MASSSVQDLSKGGDASLRALIHALAPQIINDSGGNLRSEEVTRRLNDKLEELVGINGLSSGTERRNESGELINEEGLPIIEISEPFDPTDLRTSKSLPPLVTVEPLLPLASLADDQRAKLRAKRNKILDQLEEEEKLAEFTQKKREVEEIEALSRKEREKALKEKEQMKETRELQRKMGKALLRNVSEAREKERQEEATQRLRDEEADQDRKRSPTMKKKSVAFAELTEQIERSETDPESASSTDLGEATPAQKLSLRKRPTLLSQALLDRHPMKLHVVERTPGPSNNTTPPPIRKEADSDDDSDPEYSPDSSDTEGDGRRLQTDEFDFDAAQHQREIALEYHTKRSTIGNEAAQALMVPLHDADTQQNVPQNLAKEPSKPSVSHFKANRLASAFASQSSDSLGSNVVPASSARTIQRSIRTGKLDSNGQLVGGDDSASDEPDDLQDMLELIRKGDLYNVGPNGDHIPHPPSNQHHEIPTSQTATSSSNRGESLPFQTDKLPPPSVLSKTSKFKASRTAAGRLSATVPSFESVSVNNTPFSSTATTPVSYDTRSSPKLQTPTTPIMSSSVGERTRPASSSSTVGSVPYNHILSPQPKVAERGPPGPPFSLIVDSPSFSAYGGGSGVGTIPPIVVGSSYPQNSKRLSQPPTIKSSLDSTASTTNTSTNR